MNLRQYQTTAVAAIRDAYRRGVRRPLLVLPTGGGKTVIFSYITATAASRGKNVLVLVHRVELLRQTSAKLSEFGVQHGMINPQYKPRYHESVQVASVQTVVKRLAHLTPPDLIVVDEAHHASAGTWQKILDAFPDALTLGVTATPVRADGKGLNDSFDEIVTGPTVRSLIDDGYLVQPRVFAPSTIDASALHKRMGDFDKQEAAQMMDKPTITGDAVSHYMRLCDGQPAVAFCVTVEHARHVAQEFRMRGYSAEAVDGAMDDADRKRILDGLGNGSVQVVCSCDLISEGTDIPAIACAILLRPTMSEGLYIQQVGRALRTMEGKEHAIILDHVGNVLRHGLPDMERVWSLEGKPKGKRKTSDEPSMSVKQCKSCFAVFAPAPQCPECGAAVELQGRKIEHVDGELTEITAVDRKLKRMEVGQARTLDDLKRIASERGYKRGWVYHMAGLKGIDTK
jgi:DNA repair protein RadD